MKAGSKKARRRMVAQRCGATRPKEDYLKSIYAKRERTWKHQIEGNGDSDRDKKLRAEIFGEFRRYGVMPCLWNDLK